MVRRILLSACGCAALALLACSQEPDPEVANTEPVVEEPVLTAPESTEPASTPNDTAIARTSPSVEPGSTEVEQPETSDPPSSPTPGGNDAPSVTETVDSNADPSDMPEEVVAVEPILDRVAEFYGSIESLKVSAELNRQITDGEGKPIPIPTGEPLVRELVLKRPNQLSVAIEGGGAPGVVSDGENINAYFEETGKYLGDTAPGAFSELADTEVGLALSFAGPTQLIPLLLMSSDARARLTEGVSEMEYVGHEELDETPAHRIRFTGEKTTPRGVQELTWEIWVASEGDPLVLQTSLIQGTQTVPLPNVGPTTITIALVEKLRSWELNPELADDVFVAIVPESAKPARDISDLFDPPPPLLGEEAPEVKLPLLGDSGELDLASHEETNVVILDFWATWCGPCRAGMPILAEVAEEYKEKGVVFYAVNIDEGDEQIQTFLEDEGLVLTVAKDAGGATANQFGVNGIPHSVVIGTNGIVQSVHIGFSPDLGTQLRRELDALLDGQDIFDGLPETEAETTGDSPASEEVATPEAEAPADEAAADSGDEGAAP